MNPLRGRPPGEERERRRLEREQELGHGPRDVRVHDRDPLGSPLEEAAAIIASEQWRNPAGPIESVVSRAADRLVGAVKQTLGTQV